MARYGLGGSRSRVAAWNVVNVTGTKKGGGHSRPAFCFSRASALSMIRRPTAERPPPNRSSRWPSQNLAQVAGARLQAANGIPLTLSFSLDIGFSFGDGVQVLGVGLAGQLFAERCEEGPALRFHGLG